MDRLLFHSRKEETEKAEIHLRTVEMIHNQTEAEQALSPIVLAWMVHNNLEESLNLDKEEIKKHQEVLMLCLITRDKWIN